MNSRSEYLNPMLIASTRLDGQRGVNFGNFGCTLGGTMGKGRERQIILKTDQRNVILELGLGWKFRTKSAG
jgi:hypothetical protein